MLSSSTQCMASCHNGGMFFVHVCKVSHLSLCVLAPPTTHRLSRGATIKKAGRFSFQTHTLSHSSESEANKKKRAQEDQRKSYAAALSDFFFYIFPIPLSWAHFNFMPQSWLAALFSALLLCTKALCRLDNPQYVCFHQHSSAERESNKNFSDDVMGNFSAAAHQRRQQTTKNHIYIIYISFWNLGLERNE